jgi:hypothetical protein
VLRKEKLLETREILDGIEVFLGPGPKLHHYMKTFEDKND